MSTWESVLGRMKNAPVYFALAQVRFNNLWALDTYAPGIQESFRKVGFPDAQKGVVSTFNLSPANMPSAGGELVPQQIPVVQATQHRFANMEKSEGFYLDQSSMSFQTTYYEDFEKFSKTFLKGLQIVSEAVGGLSYIERIGMRYLDAIFPKEGESLIDYLEASLLGLSDRLEGVTQYSFSETYTKTETANLLSRSIVEHGPVGLPPDLQPMFLTLQDRFSQLPAAKHATIDTDASVERRQSFDLAVVSKTLDAIHTEASNSFKASVTDFARKTWG